MSNHANSSLNSTRSHLLAVPQRGHLRRALTIAVLVTIMVACGIWVAGRWWSGRKTTSGRTPPTDPRLTYTGPFVNINPDVAYVGDERCGRCHLQETASYREHPMGRSILPMTRVADSPPNDASVHNRFEALGTQFLVTKKNGRAVHSQIGWDEKGKAVYESDMPIDYVLGSGSQGYSYLVDRDGYLFQSPVSWYSRKGIWDKSPGFSNSVRAGRPVTVTCLYCHANRTRPVAGYVNRYEKPIFEGMAIGCERCHGPGGRHVEDPGNRNAAGLDPTIVNPRHLSAELRSAVCEQCHVEGQVRVLRRGRDTYDYRPGLPLQDFWSIFVCASDSVEPSKAVNHVEQMYLSVCFANSADVPATGQRKLGCTSCHDPHQHVTGLKRTQHYREACLKCHEQHGCKVPETARRQTAKDDSCIVCHMPRYPATDVTHIASTDHRIMRRPENFWPLENKPGPDPKLSLFHADLADRDPAEFDRDLGIALAYTVFPPLRQGQSVFNRAGRRAIKLLEKAIHNDPHDFAAQEWRAKLLGILNRLDEASQAYQEILASNPNREPALVEAATVAQSQRKWDKALCYWRQAVLTNPWQPSYRASLTELLVDQHQWGEALVQARDWLRLDPASTEARTMVVRCLWWTGDNAAARREFENIERLRPPNLQTLREQFRPILNVR
jgi:hypothetical protein